MQHLLAASFFLVLIIVAIVYVQRSSGKNITALQQSNFQAAQAFEVNNRMQELVNNAQAMQLRSFNLTKNADSLSIKSLRDTAALVKQQVADLANAFNDIAHPETERFSKYLLAEIAHTEGIINAVSKGKSTNNNFTATKAPGDSLYQLALHLQRSLESDLQRSFRTSNTLADKASQLSLVISILAVLSIAVLGSLVIYRMLNQASLITKLSIEKQRADESARIKEQFLANMSHEIRTPINAVIGFTNLMQKTELDRKQQEFANLIQWSGENLLSLVNDVLDMSKLEAGKMLFTSEPFSLRDACEGIQKNFEHRLADKNLSFEIIMDSGVPELVEGDVNRLNQVLVNLVSNAIKFTTKGGVSLRVIALEKTAQKVELKFTITDTGIGIEPEKCASVFERFEQADADTTRQYGGSGLGLAIVKKIVNLQGGKVWVDSKPGLGSAFGFTVRYKPTNLAYHQLENNLTPLRNNVVFAPCNLLVVEDNKVNQTLVKYMLEQWSLQYDLAENGQEAIELLQNKTYQLILLDVQMPVMDGYAMAKHIRQKLGIATPIVAMTANAMPGEKERCVAAGMNQYLPKPLQEKLVLETLQSYLPFDVTDGGRHEGDSIKNLTGINTENLSASFNHNKNFIKEILTQFLNQYPVELRALQVAIQNKNATTAHAMAHNMKSTVSVFGDKSPLRESLGNIENFVAANDFKNANNMVQEMLNQEHDLLKEVQKLML